MVRTRNTASQVAQQRLSDGEDFDIVGSDYNSEDYYPTMIAKKRDIQKLDDGQKPVNKKSQTAQQQLNSNGSSHRNHRSTKLAKSTSEAPMVKITCVACNNAHVKCGKSDASGQPCGRCAKKGIQCVVDPNYRRARRHGPASLRQMATGNQKIPSQKPKEEEVDEDSSEDPLNSPAPTKRSISRRNPNPSTEYSTRASSRSTKPTHGNECSSSSSSPLSSAPEDSEDELDITMTDMKEPEANKKQVAVSATPKPRSTARTTRSAARKGPTWGISNLASNDNITKQDDHRVPLSMTEPMPQQRAKLDDSSILRETPPVFDQGQDQGRDEKESCDNTAVNSPSSTSGCRVASPPPDAVPEDQPVKQISLTDLRNTPTFLPKGHGSVLNPDTDKTGPHTASEQHHQQTSPLPPISHLGAGGAYIGRYDTNLALSIAPTPVPESEVPVTTSSQIVSTPTANTGNHSQASSNPPPRSSSADPGYMPPEGSPAYRYSATKILFLLKHAQRTQLLALGGAHIAPDAIAKLTSEIEDARARGLTLWHAVHDNLALGEEIYDAGGLKFLQEFGRI